MRLFVHRLARALVVVGYRRDPDGEALAQGQKRRLDLLVFRNVASGRSICDQLGILVVGVAPDSSPMLTAPAATEPSPVSRSKSGPRIHHWLGIFRTYHLSMDAALLAIAMSNK